MRTFRISIVAAAAALLLVGCGSADSSGGSAEPEAADAVEDGAVEEGAVDGASGAADPQVDAGNRDVIYESTLEVADPDPDRVAEEAWDLAESLGGYVSADERDLSTAGDAVHGSAHLSMRIPSEHFQEAMDGLTALAESEVRRSVTTEDVTEAVVDLESYIATKSASVARVRELLAEATSVTAILELETELAEREGELASLQQQLADLEDRIALSTIDFTVTAPYVPVAEESGYTGPDSFWDGLVTGFKGAVAVVVALSVVLGVLLPFLPLAALAAAAVVVPLRWRARRRRSAAPVSPQPHPAGAPQPRPQAQPQAQPHEHV
ncbi:DUF4349 domain-containing protein [Glycomyces albidus]|uniref:DUF4349 domain-containing protein n=1 Tax=Glycomyces albidus TaxID=2656774 RepID=A0A6L5GE99_9ACTN|nr:DUF4349 domain-containing protein [Glycomyces albidus]MQM28034.1 DUF4349 domain-containing protein [Glycomyces albidus]